RHPARQPCVAVQRDAIADLGKDGHVADRHDEARIGGTAQQAIEFFDLPALAFPSHPEAFAFVPLAQTMKEEEPIRGAVSVLGVEGSNPRARRLENLLVAWRSE